MASIIHWSLRRDNVCVPQMCPDSIEETDELGFITGYRQCDHCQLQVLDDAVRSSNHNNLLGVVLDLDFALESGYTKNLDDAYADEFYWLRRLRVERIKVQREEQERKRQREDK